MESSLRTGKRLVLRGAVWVGAVVATATVAFALRAQTDEAAITPTPIGCYRDQGDPHSAQGRDLSGFGKEGQTTVESCIAQCKQQNFAYAGMQDGDWCFCGNSYGRNGTADNCDSHCSGNSSEVCGGSWANTVYATGVGAPAPTPTTPTTTGAPPPGPLGPTCQAGAPEPSTVTANHEVKTMDQPESRSGGTITVEKSKIHVIQCDAGSSSGQQYYIYEYENRPGFRAIQVPDWGHALGGRDFCTEGEAINAACATTPSTTTPGPTTPGTPSTPPATPAGPTCQPGAPEPSTVTANHEVQTMDQPESRSNGTITVEKSKIHVIQCDAGPSNGQQYYIYEYENRPGFRAIKVPDWGHALGGRDFCTEGEAINAACATTPAGTPPSTPPSTTPSTTPSTAPSTPPGPPQQIDWNTNAVDHKDHVGQRFTYTCPAATGQLITAGWGTDVYTDDSPICPAAVHAGIITTQGGPVTIEMRPGQSSYKGSTRNGLSTGDYGAWESSYVFVKP